MAKSQNDSSFRAGLFKFSLYKRNQGRLVRQLTAVAASVLIFFGTYTLSKGPLSTYVNSYLTTTARYAGDKPDPALDTSLQQLAQGFGGEMAEARFGRYRELEFHFRTSRNFATDQELVDEMKKKSGDFALQVDLDNSYPVITALYKGDEADAALEKKLGELAGGQERNPKLTKAVLDEVRNEVPTHKLTFAFSLSKKQETGEVIQSLVDEMEIAGEGLALDVDWRYAARVRVSKPRGQSRRAVGISIGIPILLCLFGLWLVFRAVNFPRFADFLISVEAEMDKVSWPGRPELYRSTAVVVSTMFMLGFMLLAYDVFWKFFFELVGFLRIPG